MTDLEQRLRTVEHRLRFFQHATTFVLILAVIAAFAAFRNRVPDVIRTRALIVEDSLGHAVVVIGAPVPDPVGGRRRSAATGMVINDAKGEERAGFSLNADGGVVIGLDAPPSDGNANRERITLSVNSKGAGELRFLDHKSLVRMHTLLFEDNNVVQFFTTTQDGKTFVHRLDAMGDSVIVHNK